MPVLVPPQVQDFALPLVELYEIPVSPFLQPVILCGISIIVLEIDSAYEKIS